MSKGVRRGPVYSLVGEGDDSNAGTLGVGIVV